MQAWRVCVFICACMTQVSSEDEFKLPSYIDVCYRDDPEVAGCLKKAIEKLVPIFKTGSRDFELDALDPLVYPNLRFNYKSPIVGGSLQLTDARVNQLSKLTVTEVRPMLKNPGEMIIDFDISVPYAKLTSFYNLTGNVARIPVKVDGYVEGEVDDLAITYHVAGDVETIGEYDFLILKKFSWRLKGEGVTNARITNDNIVNNYPGLNQVVKTVVNSSWRILKDNVLPVAYRESEDRLREMFSAFFKKYPYDILFPRKTRL